MVDKFITFSEKLRILVIFTFYKFMASKYNFLALDFRTCKNAKMACIEKYANKTKLLMIS